MNNGILSKVVSEIHDTNAENRADKYVMVNVRPGEKVSAMLEVISHLSQKTPSAVIANKLSSQIAHYAISSLSFSEAILDAAEKAINEDRVIYLDTALDKLEKDGVIKCSHPKLAALLFGDKKEKAADT